MNSNSIGDPVPPHHEKFAVLASDDELPRLTSFLATCAKTGLVSYDVIDRLMEMVSNGAASDSYYYPHDDELLIDLLCADSPIGTWKAVKEQTPDVIFQDINFQGQQASADAPSNAIERWIQYPQISGLFLIAAYIPYYGMHKRPLPLIVARTAYGANKEVAMNFEFDLINEVFTGLTKAPIDKISIGGDYMATPETCRKLFDCLTKAAKQKIEQGWIAADEVKNRLRLPDVCSLQGIVDQMRELADPSRTDDENLLVKVQELASRRVGYFNVSGSLSQEDKIQAEHRRGWSIQLKHLLPVTVGIMTIKPIPKWVDCLQSIFFSDEPDAINDIDELWLQLSGLSSNTAAAAKVIRHLLRYSLDILHPSITIRLPNLISILNKKKATLSISMQDKRYETEINMAHFKLLTIVAYSQAPIDSTDAHPQTADHIKTYGVREEPSTLTKALTTFLKASWHSDHDVIDWPKERTNLNKSLIEAISYPVNVIPLGNDYAINPCITVVDENGVRLPGGHPTSPG